MFYKHLIYICLFTFKVGSDDGDLCLRSQPMYRSLMSWKWLWKLFDCGLNIFFTTFTTQEYIIPTIFHWI